VREQLAEGHAHRHGPTVGIRRSPALLEAKIEGRDRSTIENRRRRAHFPAGKAFGSCVESRSYPPATQRALRNLERVFRAEHMVVAGAQRTGKSHLLEALGHHAIDQGLSVGWFSIEDLGVLKRRHRVDDSISRTFAAHASVQITIIDVI
jgi:DNA replication protein DnaC